MSRLHVIAALALLGACSDTGQERVALPLQVAGTDLSAPILTAGDIAITVTRAELAFGPLYLCAGDTAGDLCDTARLEWLDSVVVDLGDPSPASAGELTGVSGEVASWMYDLGISSQLTADRPSVLAAAAELGGTSLVVNGRATLGGVEIPFRVSVPVQQTDDTELGVPVIRKSTSEAFSHEVDADETGLLVRFDAAAWLRTVDLRGYVEDAACEVGGAPIVCAGAVEQSCDAEGRATTTRDCSELDQVCLAGRGCAAELSIEPESEAYRALRNAITSGSRPTFEWSP